MERENRISPIGCKIKKQLSGSAWEIFVYLFILNKISLLSKKINVLQKDLIGQKIIKIINQKIWNI